MKSSTNYITKTRPISVEQLSAPASVILLHVPLSVPLSNNKLQNMLELGCRPSLGQKRASSPLHTSPSPCKCLTPFGRCTVTTIPCTDFRKSCTIKPQCNKNSMCNMTNTSSTTNSHFNSEHPSTLQVQRQDCAFNTLLIKNSAPCKLHIIKFLHYPVSVSHYCISFMF